MEILHVPILARSLANTMHHMLGLEPRLSDVSSEAPAPVRADVSAALTVVGSPTACVVLCMDAMSAIDATRRFVQEECKLDDPLVGDAVRELLNMTVGSARREITEPFEFSLPKSEQGENHEVKWFQNGIKPFIRIDWDNGHSCQLYLNILE